MVGNAMPPRALEQQEWRCLEQGSFDAGQVGGREDSGCHRPMTHVARTSSCAWWNKRTVVGAEGSWFAASSGQTVLGAKARMSVSQACT